MKLLAVTLFAGISAAAYAQNGQAVSNLAKDGGAPPPANAMVVGTLTKSDPLRSIPETPAGVEPVVNYPLALVWNDKQKDLTLNYQNPLKQVLTIEGVQASGNLFVVDYPHVILPQGSGSIKFAFVVQPGSQSDSDIVRLLTSDGIKLLKVPRGDDLRSRRQPHLRRSLGLHLGRRKSAYCDADPHGAFAEPHCQC